jgi:hypothetical protein
MNETINKFHFTDNLMIKSKNCHAQKWPNKHLTVVLDDSPSNKKLIQLITVVLLYRGQY